MKKGYKRLIVFLSALIFIFLINTFCINILSGYKTILFLIVLLPIFDIYFMMEKDRHRYMKDIYFEVFIYVMFFFVFYYLLGLVVGLAKTSNYYSFIGFKQFIIPIIGYTILREILRYNLLCKAEGSKICTILVVVLIFLMDISDDYYFAVFKSQYDILKFIALTALPMLARNICYSYLSRKTGYKPVIIFDLVFTLFPYLIPVIPNPSEYIVSVIYLLLPIIFVYRIVNFFEKKKDNLLPSNYKKRHVQGIILPVIIIMTLVYFYSGYFRYYAVAIASGSMSTKIERGDIVIIDQKDHEFEIGEVMAYKREGLIIVHRVVNKIILGDSVIYYTKGDANNNVDDIVIEEDMIIGKVNHKIKYVGYPTVWFNKE